jgi:hypothetical protein
LCVEYFFKDGKSFYRIFIIREKKKKIYKQLQLSLVQNVPSLKFLVHP